MSKELFEYNGIGVQELEEHPTLERIKYLMDILTTPTEVLIKMLETEIFPEIWDKRNPPYLSKQHIFAILEHRKRFQSDVVAKKFLKKQKKNRRYC